MPTGASYGLDYYRPPTKAGPVVGWTGTGQPTYGGPTPTQTANQQAAQTQQTNALSALEQQRQRLALEAQQQAFINSTRLMNASDPQNVTIKSTGIDQELSRGPGAGGAGAGGAGGGGLSADQIAAILKQSKPEPEPKVDAPPLPPAPQLPPHVGIYGGGGGAFEGGGGGGAVGPPGLPGTGISPGPSLAFSRAKDVAGRQGSAALSALKDVMSSRNMGKSSMEGRESANILSDLAQHLTDVEFEDVTNREQRAFDAAMEQ
jgi:hypothetical protein